MSRFDQRSPRQQLVHYVQELERLEELKKLAAENVKEAFQAAKNDGFDPATLKVVLKLRKMTSSQRRERRALEDIYMAALGMLDGEGLSDEARRRLDGQPPREGPEEPSDSQTRDGAAPPEPPASPPAHAPAQPPLVLKTPDEARQEGEVAAAAGKRIYDNPYPAGDPCRAAWDEGWCTQQKSHGMETPAAYQRRTPPKDKRGDDDQASGADGASEKGAA